MRNLRVGVREICEKFERRIAIEMCEKFERRIPIEMCENFVRGV